MKSLSISWSRFESFLIVSNDDVECVDYDFTSRRVYAFLSFKSKYVHWR